MKHNPRPFVVEVKRGTSRHSFQSHSLDSDKFCAAEKLLFSAPQADRIIDAASSIRPGPSGRVLPVLPDLQQIVLAEPFPAPRRGRPPGSKNKAKQLEALLPVAAPVAPLIVEAASVVAQAKKQAVADHDIGLARVEDDLLIAPAVTEPPVESSEGPTRAIRLRDRSRILRRYVLGVEPRAGERRSFRNRKAAASDVQRKR